MIYNTHDQLVQAVTDGIIPRNKAIAITYRPYDRWHSRAWLLYSPFFYTDPTAHWTDNRQKAFDIGQGKIEKQKGLDTAKAWAQEKYGITDWLPNRLHDWVPAIVEEIQPIPKEEEHESKPRLIR